MGLLESRGHDRMRGAEDSWERQKVGRAFRPWCRPDAYRGERGERNTEGGLRLQPHPKGSAMPRGVLEPKPPTAGALCPAGGSLTLCSCPAEPLRASGQIRVDPQGQGGSAATTTGTGTCITAHVCTMNTQCFMKGKEPNKKN